jgi:hypothetical protein
MARSLRSARGPRFVTAASRNPPTRGAAALHRNARHGGASRRGVTHGARGSWEGQPMKSSRLAKPLCFLLLLAMPIAAIVFASRTAHTPSVAHARR